MKYTRVQPVAILILALFAFGVYLHDNHTPTVSAATTTILNTSNGNWSDSSIWDLGRVPQSGDKVIISAGTSVIYDVLSNEIISGLELEGTLRVSRTTDTRLKLDDNLFVLDGGSLDMGTEQDPILRPTRHELIFVFDASKSFQGGPAFVAGDTGLWVFSGGEWNTHGQPLVRTWSKISKDALAGDNTITVENDLGDWNVGGKIVVSSSRSPIRYYIRTSDNKEMKSWIFEEELRTITNIEILASGETRLTLDSPLDFDHSGTGPMRAEVGHLTRNILVTTELSGYSDPDGSVSPDYPQRRFSHTMFMKGAIGNVMYTEFKYMGHHDTLARYPIHLHMMDETSKGMVIRGNAVWNTGNRWVTIHDTEEVTVEDNVGFDGANSGYFIERSPNRWAKVNDIKVGGPINNVLIHNMGVKLEGMTDNAVFWMDKLDQRMFGNVGSGARGNKAAGFGTESNSNNTGFESPLLFFKNEAHSNESFGIRTWNNAVPGFDMVDLKLWRNGDAGIRWGAYGAANRYYHTEILENAKFGLQVLSIMGFLQDSIVRGGGDGNASEQKGFFVNGYIAQTFPHTPIKLIRTEISDFKTSDMEQSHEICDDGIVPDEDKYISTRNGQCVPSYTESIGSSYNSNNPLVFGWQQNKNTYWKMNDYSGSLNLPKDFVVFRKDQNDPAHQTDMTKRLVTSETFYSPEVDALITPLSSFPDDLVFIGLESYDGVKGIVVPYDFTFNLQADVPPQVSLTVTTSGTIATLNANVSDDNGISSVEFWVDEILIGEMTSGPFTQSVDLSASGRKYAYLYVKAFDTAGNKSYSKVQEIGPEVILGSATIQPPANQSPSANAGADLVVTLPDSASLGGSFSDDGLPSSGSVTTAWSKVSGPGSVTFGNASNLNTSASFSTDGVYTLRLTVDDSALSDTDDITITVNPQAVIPPPSGTPVLSLSNVNGNVGDSSSVDLVLTDAPNGISGFLLEISVGDTSIAKIDSVSLQSGFASIDPSQDSTTSGMATFSGVDTDNLVNPGDSNILLATIDITALQEGTSSLNISVDLIDDDSGAPFSVDVVNGSISVAANIVCPTLVGLSQPSLDHDGDGLCEDINGNGRLDFDDVAELFEHLNSPIVQNNSAMFDFNNSGNVDMDDIVELFSLLIVP